MDGRNANYLGSRILHWLWLSGDQYNQIFFINAPREYFLPATTSPCFRDYIMVERIMEKRIAIAKPAIQK